MSKSILEQTATTYSHTQNSKLTSTTSHYSVDPENAQALVMKSEAEQIAWMWALVFAFAFPELFVFLRALRICVFKNLDIPSKAEQLCVVVFDLLHVLGLALFTFRILPNIDAVQGVMLTNCLSFIPAVLGKWMPVTQTQLQMPQWVAEESRHNV